MSGYGEALKTWREAAGMTSQEVADAAGVSAAYLSRVEHEEVRPAWRWGQAGVDRHRQPSGRAGRLMGGPSLVEVLPTPDPETVRKLLALLAPATVADGEDAQ